MEKFLNRAKTYISGTVTGRMSSKNSCAEVPLYDYDPKTEWMTKDKEIIKITDLTESHLRNCIWIVYKYKDKKFWRVDSLEYLEDELERRMTVTEAGKLLYG